MTIPDDDPVVRRLKAFHDAETARATRDLARDPRRLSSPTIRSSLPRLLSIGVALLAVGIIASVAIVGGSRSGQAAIPSASPAPSPAPSPATSAAPSSSPPHAQAQQGRFRLDFELPKAVWMAGEPIDGLATLSLVDGTAADIGGSGGGLFAFGYVDPAGRHDVGPVWRADCRSYRLAADRPMTSGLTKSGGFSPDDPDIDFIRTFLTGPVVRLPAGDWTITAVVPFVEGTGCTGATHDIRASIPIRVLPPSPSEAPASMANPMPTPSVVADSIGRTSFERPTTWLRTQPNAFNPISDGPLIYLSTDPLLPACGTPVGQPVHTPDAQGRACEWPLTSLSSNGVLVTWGSTRILRPIPNASPTITINGAATSLDIERPGACAAIGATGEAQVRAMLESATVSPGAVP